MVMTGNNTGTKIRSYFTITLAKYIFLKIQLDF